MFVRLIRVLVMFLFLVTHHSLLITDDCSAAIRDRVIAFVDDDAITMSELTEQFRLTSEVSPDITMNEVLNTMINRLLLLREAKKFRIEAPTKEEVLNEYIDLKLRSFIRVGDSDVESYYRDNISNFGSRSFEDVREEIEKYLTEKELNERLREFLNMLVQKAHIRNYLDAD